MYFTLIYFVNFQADRSKDALIKMLYDHLRISVIFRMNLNASFQNKGLSSLRSHTEKVTDGHSRTLRRSDFLGVGRDVRSA